jgi:hypothetical protein
VNLSLDGKKHIAQRRTVAEAKKKTTQLFIANLCFDSRTLASLREFVYFFTPSTAVGKPQSLTLQPASAGDRVAYSGRLFLSPLPGLFSCSASSSHSCRRYEKMGVASGGL